MPNSPQIKPLIPAPGQKPKILVVDDVEANRQIVSRRLDDGIYDVFAVNSGAEALRFIEENKPDLVLLDYMMPQMNGIDVLNVVRKEWKVTDLPIIMLTARAEADAVVAALEAGADDYISKPIDFNVLTARIETQLDKFKSKGNLLQANAALDERANMRVLAFDQLRDELEREILLRKKAEQELIAFKNLSAPDQSGSGADETGVEQLPSAPHRDEALQIIHHLIEASSTGRPINQAMLHSLKSKIENM